MATKNQEGHLSCRDPQRVPAPHLAPQPRAPVPGKEVPITFCCENEQGVPLRKTKGCRRPKHTAHRRPVHKFIHLKLTISCGSRSESTRDIQGDTKLTIKLTLFMVSAREAKVRETLQVMKALINVIAPSVSSPLTQPAQHRGKPNLCSPLH